MALWGTHFRSPAQVIDLERERREQADAVDELEARRKGLSSDDPVDIAQQRKKIQSDLAALDADLALVQVGGSLAVQWDAANTKWQTQQAKLTELERHIDEIEQQIKANQVELAQHQVSQELSRTKIQQLTAMKKRFDALSVRCPLITQIQGPRWSHDRLTDAALDPLEDALDQQLLARDAMMEALRRLVAAQVVDDPKGWSQQSNPSLSQMNELFNRADAIYADLAVQQRLLAESVAAHNEIVGSTREALLANADHIERFSQRLNRDLQSVRINDLAEIQVLIHTDRRFKSLVREAAMIDPHAGQLVAEAFYERLAEFAADFFTDDVGQRLTMDKVITGLTYKIRKAGQDQLDDKGQSTSTVVLINLELVRLLLKAVLAPGYHLCCPVVLDELPRVDFGQIGPLLDRLYANGFRLFSASTAVPVPRSLLRWATFILWVSCIRRAPLIRLGPQCIGGAAMVGPARRRFRPSCWIHEAGQCPGHAALVV